MTIFARILIACILPFIIIFSAVIFSISNIVHDKVVSFANEISESFAAEASKQIDDGFANVHGLVEVVGKHAAEVDVSSPYAEEKLSDWIKSILKATPYVYCIWVSYEPDEFIKGGGRFSRDFVNLGDSIFTIHDLDDDILDDPDEAPWYYYPFTTGQIWFENADWYDYGLGFGGKYTGTVSSPIVRDGKNIGVVGIDMLYENIFKFINERQIEDERMILIVTQDGEIVFSSDSGLMKTSLFDLPFAKQDFVVKSFGTYKPFSVNDISPLFGVPSKMFFHPISNNISSKNTQLFLYVDLPIHKLFKDAANIDKIVILIGVVGLCTFIFSLFLTIKNILKPIKTITKDASMISSGNVDLTFDTILDANLHNKKTRSRNEFHTMFLALKNMRQTLKMTEKYKALSQAKSDFLAKMSHEIRTPMNAITGMAELAMHEEMSTAAKGHVHAIKQASANLLSIINDILDLSKIESGKLEIAPVDYKFASLINDVISIIRVRIGSIPISFEINLDDLIPSVLFGDEARVRQVLLNILSNAVKYTKEGSITLTINGNIIDKDTVVLTIDVADTGRGIKEEDIEKLFGDFVQLDLAANNGVEGTGLGLSITKNLVMAMNGAIGVKSVYGEGSTFTVTLPQGIRSLEPMATFNKSSEIAVIKFNAPSAKILVVDDIKTNLEVAKGLLSLYKMQIDTSLNGIDAIDAVKTNAYDMIFMDHMMPGIDGIEATKRIRDQLGGVYAQLPIVALTANAVSGTREMFLQNGFNDFLPKPIDITQLGAILEKWIPKEKQTAAENTVNDDFNSNADIVISGVDVELGISRTGGSVDTYLRTLSVFSDDGRQKIHEIKKCMETDDTRLFTTYIHALKSAAANIGAIGLSEAARALEEAGKRYDKAFITENTPHTLEYLKTVLNHIDIAVSKKKPSQNQVADTDKDAIDAILTNLQRAINDIDPPAINAAIKKLEHYENAIGIGKPIKDVVRHVLNGEYDAIDDILINIKKFISPK